MSSSRRSPNPTSPQHHWDSSLTPATKEYLSRKPPSHRGLFRTHPNATPRKITPPAGLHPPHAGAEEKRGIKTGDSEIPAPTPRGSAKTPPKTGPQKAPAPPEDAQLQTAKQGHTPKGRKPPQTQGKAPNPDAEPPQDARERPKLSQSGGKNTPSRRNLLPTYA